jgi:hypothetical protein
MNPHEHIPVLQATASLLLPGRGTPARAVLRQNQPINVCR